MVSSASAGSAATLQCIDAPGEKKRFNNVQLSAMYEQGIQMNILVVQLKVL